MKIKELRDIINSPLLADNVPIIVNRDDYEDLDYTITAVQNSWGRWAVVVDVEE